LVQKHKVSGRARAAKTNTHRKENAIERVSEFSLSRFEAAERGGKHLADSRGRARHAARGSLENWREENVPFVELTRAWATGHFGIDRLDGWIDGLICFFFFFALLPVAAQSMPSAHTPID
jgi:hypothetical protein